MWLLPVAVAGFAIIVSFHRAHGAFLQPQLIAEDGPILFQQQFVDGWKAIFRPYAGYLIVFQRLAALVATHFGSPAAPHLYLVAWCGALTWSVWTIARCNWPYAWVYAAAVMLTPQNGNLIGTLTNTQWYLATAMIFVAVTPSPTELISRVNQIALLIVSGLSGPFTLIAAPLAVFRFIWGQSGFDKLVAFCLLGTGAIQAFCVASSYEDRVPRSTGNAGLALLQAFDRWFGQLIHGSATDTFIEGALVATLLATVITAVVRDREKWRLILLILFSLGLIVGGWLKYRAVPGAFEGGFRNDRYFVIPKTVLIWILIRSALAMQPVSLLACACMVSIGLHYPFWLQRPQPLLPWTEPAQALDRGEGMQLLVNPPSGRWRIDIPPKDDSKTSRVPP